MCLGNCIRGRDQLRQDILETDFTIDLPDNCNYVECNNSIKIHKEDLSFLELNIRGLYSKVSELIQLLDSVSPERLPDVILLCETWLTQHTPTFNIPGYKIWQKNRIGKRGGGVCILTSEKLRTKDRSELNIVTPDFECCGVEIITNTHPILALSIYRRPNTNPTNFITELSKMVQVIKKSKPAGIVVGLDHNMDFLKCGMHVPTHRFLDEIMDLGLIPSITRPTRIIHSTATLIDNILIDQKFIENYKSSILIDNISNHLPCLTTLCGVTSPQNHDRTIISRDVSKQNLEHLARKLKETDWGFLEVNKDVNSKFDSFHEYITEVIDNFCQLKERKIKYKNVRHEPWVTSGVMISIKKFKKLYKNNIKADRTPKDVSCYVHYNTCLRKVKRGAKKLYYLQKCEEFKHNTKKLWGTINRICGKTSNKSMCIESLKVDNVTTYNTAKITDSFGKYFASVGK